MAYYHCPSRPLVTIQHSNAYHGGILGFNRSHYKARITYEPNCRHSGILLCQYHRYKHIYNVYVTKTLLLFIILIQVTKLLSYCESGELVYLHGVFVSQFALSLNQDYYTPSRVLSLFVWN